MAHPGRVIRPADIDAAGGVHAAAPVDRLDHVAAALDRIERRLDRLDAVLSAAVSVLPLPLRMKLGRALNG